MQPFKNFSGIVAFLDRSNIDTDAIIPKQFMKSIKRNGFSNNLFHEWRYKEPIESSDKDKELKCNPEFILNNTPYDKAEILLTKENFGCGSSREHAVWALKEFGFKVIIAESYGDIFYNNALKNGLLTIKLKSKEIDELFRLVNFTKGFKLFVNIEEQRVGNYFFDIDKGLKDRLVQGLDDIELTLKISDKIKDYEIRKSKLEPWLFKGIEDKYT